VFGLCGASYHVYLKERRGGTDLGADRLEPPRHVGQIERLVRRQRAMYPARFA
jgi:hypothetical protein